MVQKTKRRTSIPHLNEYVLFSHSLQQQPCEQRASYDTCRFHWAFAKSLWTVFVSVSSRSRRGWGSESAGSAWVTTRLCTTTRTNYGKHVRRDTLTNICVSTQSHCWRTAVNAFCFCLHMHASLIMSQIFLFLSLSIWPVLSKNMPWLPYWKFITWWSYSVWVDPHTRMSKLLGQ